MGQKLRSPHLLNASSNVRAMLVNLAHCIPPSAITDLEKEVARQSQLLFKLGVSHYRFASKQPTFHWRQKISRLYYGAYNCKRAVQLFTEGSFRMDSSDHQTVSKLPDGFPNRSTYEVRLRALREDRNLADYNHESKAADLAHKTADSQAMVDSFISDARKFLKSKGLIL